jgi:putative flippase GtrA
MNSSRQFMIFILVGTISVIIDVGLLIELVRLGVPPFFAVTIAFFFGLLINLWLHADLTFRTCVNTQNAMRFFMVIVMNYVLTMGFVFLFEQLGLSYLIGKIISLPLVAIHGFLWGRLWVFKP